MKDQNLLIQNGVDLAKSLELFGDMDMYNESLGDFMAEVNDKLFKIGRFKEMVDMPNYAILVHSLKSDAKYFGFAKLAELAYEHELKSKENNTVYVNEHYNELITEANRIIALINQYLSSSAAPTPNVMPSLTPSTANPQPASNTILVVDDSEIIKNFVKKIFANNYTVMTASDGAEAIEMISKNQDLLAMLLDLNMPNVDGFKVLDYMKENNLFGKIPVSIITGNDAREIDMNAFEYPIVDILKKPFNEASVKNIIDRTIASKH